MYKTDYYGIHERTYKILKDKNQRGWGGDEHNEEKNRQIKIALEILEKYNISKNEKILEIGCGDAELALQIAEKGYNTYGVDISDTAILWANEKAKKRMLSENFSVGSVLDLKYSKDSFQAIIDSYCLHCIIGNDRAKLFKTVNSVLKKDGLFIGFTMCNKIPIDMKEYFDPKTGILSRSGIAGRYIGNYKDILEEFIRNNFTIVEYQVEKAIDETESDTLIYVLKK